MKKLIFAVMYIYLIIILLASCSNERIEFPDSEIATTKSLKSGSLISVEAAVQTITFSKLTWYVKSGTAMGPGPNNWNTKNVWVDNLGKLHLRITYSEATGKWDCAEIWTTNSLGFGTYEWDVEGSLNLHQDVVLGLFNYLPAKIARKAAEIDIEIAKWGNPNNANILSYAVWPPRVISGGYHWSSAFPLPANINYSSTTHRFIWTSRSVSFQSFYDVDQEISATVYAPSSPTKYIPQVAVPARINLWVFGGQSSTLSKSLPVEVIISSFRQY